MSGIDRMGGLGGSPGARTHGGALLQSVAGVALHLPSHQGPVRQMQSDADDADQAVQGAAGADADGLRVAPLFQSPAGHLRAKACWICGQFADIRFAEGKGLGQSFMG